MNPAVVTLTLCHFFCTFAAGCLLLAYVNGPAALETARNFALLLLAPSVLLFPGIGLWFEIASLRKHRSR